MKNVYEHARTVGITESPEFQKKQLANHALNVGLLCGHGCKYCSTAALLRRNNIFKSIGMSSFEALQAGIAIVDPSTPTRAIKQAKKLKPTDTVMLSTTTDPYAPEAQTHDLGRQCALAVLENSQASLRVLTKNKAVSKDLDLFAAYRDRVMLGLSVTSPVSKENIVSILEPSASTISERLAVYREAKSLGIRLFGMLCPLLPGIASSRLDIQDMMQTILEFNPETIWVEPINPRGDCLIKCSETLSVNGFKEEAYQVNEIRKHELHQLYADDLIDDATKVARKIGCLDKLRILVYSDGKEYSCDKTAVVWLKS